MLKMLEARKTMATIRGDPPGRKRERVQGLEGAERVSFASTGVNWTIAGSAHDWKDLQETCRRKLAYRMPLQRSMLVTRSVDRRDRGSQSLPM
jgi:hypothetical protein